MSYYRWSSDATFSFNVLGLYLTVTQIDLQSINPRRNRGIEIIIIIIIGWGYSDNLCGEENKLPPQH